ncbi:hypothetical protein L0P51_05870 [Acetatifactor sp. DFI.5.50]|nr:hypothetical protein [Lacrimispora saccharolytica]MCG4780462.1 hypothetical protein [Acetatifactor sp. DFI.5.50]
MVKRKFKVGDVVKPNKKADENYTITTTSVVREAIVTELRDYTMEIKIIKGSCSVGEVFTVEEKCFDLVRKAKQETIVIYRKDNKVVALDKSTGEKAEANCNPADEFDFRTGAKLAFNRLMGEDVKPDNGVREVKRKAKVGEYIKIVDAKPFLIPYENGEIFIVIGVKDATCEVENSVKRCHTWHSEYVVLENYKPEEKVQEQNDSEIHVGDMVEVTRSGGCYSAYDTWSGLGSYRQNFVKGVSVEDGMVAKVLNIAQHGDDKWKTLALIQNPNTTQVFIINIDGIKKVER